ncbi:MAG: GNAT family N-acetyltransferase [Pseudomonadota bacterium]
MILDKGRIGLLENVAEDLFDQMVQRQLVEEFLTDPRHHLAIAEVEGLVIGFASAVHYVHPDKPTELWINEIGVADAYQSQGIGKRLMKTLFALGRQLGCAEAWVLADQDNHRARAFYESLGGDASPAVMYSFKTQ